MVAVGTTRGLWVRAVLAGAVVLVAVPPVASAAPERAGRAPRAAAPDPVACRPGPMPFAELPGVRLEPEHHVSKDAEPVAYVRWRGMVPSFDGLPLSVDVTVPCTGADGPLPLVTMLHGFTDDKTVWEETGKSDTVESTDRPGPNSRWNNIWFASRGYVTLNYTARGWRDSCGPDTPGWQGDTPPPQCAGHEYWIHLDDKRWEVRDAQWLTAGLVSSGIADPERLAITGGSYGGAPAASAAMLAGSTMCGAAPQPEELGEDPCEGAADGELVPWTTADGTTPLTWAAAVPMYTFSSLMRVLAPNGRWSDGTLPGSLPAGPTDPIGVPLKSTIDGLLLAGDAFGSFAPTGADPDSDIRATTGRLLAGDPYDDEDVALAERYEQFTSPITTQPQGAVPILWIQGTTDSLFPASEALAMLSHVRAQDPDYPMQVFLGDLGHDVAAERLDDWGAANRRMRSFLEQHLERAGRDDVDGTSGGTDRRRVAVSVTRCGDRPGPQRLLEADEWPDLADDELVLRSDVQGTTSTRTSGPSGAAIDPISTATLGGPGSYKGCRHLPAGAADPTVVATSFSVDEATVLVGSPLVSIGATATGPDAQVAVRLWDVDPASDRRWLVTRGVHRGVPGESAAGPTELLLAPQAYRFEAGHEVLVEVTANDEPYLLANRQPSTVAVDGLSLALPVRRSAEDVEPRAVQGEDPPAVDGDDRGGSGQDAFAWMVVGASALALGLAIRRSTRATGT